jgi:amino acid permease
MIVIISGIVATVLAIAVGFLVWSCYKRKKAKEELKADSTVNILD